MPLLASWTGVIGLLLLIIVAAVAVVVVLYRSGRTQSSPYEACPLLTPAERVFWLVLQKCVPSGHALLAKVRLADIVNVKKGFDAKTRQGHFNRISRKHADFVVCDGSELTPRVVLELDDSSHNSKSASRRDDQKDRILEGAGLRVLRFRAQRTYDAGQIREELAEALTNKAPSDVKDPAATVPPPDSASPPRTQSPGKACPKCGAEMVLRTARQGAAKGTQFWGCSRYPQCKGIVAQN